MKQIIFILIFGFILLPVVSAGVGIKWSQESVLVNEGEKPCLTYSVYNPWPEESFVKIELSDELKRVLIMQESDSKHVPSNTPSTSAIPIEFCFKVPKVYPDECMLFGKLICHQTCSEVQKSFLGEVLVKSLPPTTTIGGSGGSTTTMSVSAPLRIKVNCISSSYLTNKKNLTFIFLLTAIIAFIIITVVMKKRYSKNQLQRDEDRLKRLKERIKLEKKKKKK
jgi:hypothetical protein